MSKETKYTQEVQVEKGGGILDVAYYFTPRDEGDSLTPPIGPEIGIISITCLGSPDLYLLLEAYKFDFNRLHETIIENHESLSSIA